MNTLKNLLKEHKGFLLLIGLMFVFRSAVADWNLVPSSSMNPTLISGDRVVVNKLAYSLRVPFTLNHMARWGSPKRGDVITFDSPADELNLIKRVVAVAGDRVQMQGNVVSINGQIVPRVLVDEKRLVPSEMGDAPLQIWAETLGNKRYESARTVQANRFTSFDEVTVPAGHVMVLGDSRDNSNDSRFIGFIDIERITGQAVRVALSHNFDNWYVPRAGRWWVQL
jgi:signal peptidase I